MAALRRDPAPSTDPNRYGTFVDPASLRQPPHGIRLFGFIRLRRPPLMFGDEPAYAIVTSAVCCALLAWIIGPLVTPWVQAAADGARSILDGWMSNRLSDITHAPSTANTVGSGFIVWLVQLPFILVMLGAYSALALTGIVLFLADGLHLFPFIGAYLGLIPGYHSLPFVKMGRSLPILIAYGSDLARARTRTDRLWAAAPFVLLVASLLTVWLAIVPALTRQSWWPSDARAVQAPVHGSQPELLVRYTSSISGWRGDDAVSPAYRFRLHEVTLERRSLEVVLRVINLSDRPETFYVDRGTRIETLAAHHGVENLPALGTRDRTYTVPVRGFVDVPVRFSRPRLPFRRWRLWFYAADKPGVVTRVYLDLNLHKP